MSQTVPLAIETTHAGASFDGPRLYRYRLWRQWAWGQGTATFIMLNPSTADEVVLDPTIRRCVSFAARWGHGRLEVVNLYAWRSTNPDDLLKVSTPVGPDNDAAIVAAARSAAVVIAAWGSHAAARTREAEVVDLLRRDGIRLHALRVSQGGHPAHPLYLRGDVQPQEWRA